MYHLVFGLLYLLSLLPFRVLYGLSDLAAFVLHRVVKYRASVVMDNLLHAFPEKKVEERKRIAKAFYRNFTDNWVETIKLISISKQALLKRVSGDLSLFQRLHAEGRSVQASSGHFFNWEMLNLYNSIGQPYMALTVYLPQNSRIFDRLMTGIRSRWGNPQLPSTNIVRAIIPWRNKQYFIGLVADQSNPILENLYWLNFMNRPAGFMKGPEKLARGQNLAVIVVLITKPRRGHYHFEYELVTEDPKSLPEGELIRRYVKLLEKNLRLQPEIYLWSHRRWKHAWKPELEKNWVDESEVPGGLG